MRFRLATPGMMLAFRSRVSPAPGDARAGKAGPPRIMLALGLLCVLTFGAQGRGDTLGSPSKSVFRLLVVKREVSGYETGYRGVASGTAFFIAPDGRALTNSHVVSLVQQNRINHRLIAIVGNEFFGARLICASSPPPEINGKSPLSRDVAEIQVTPPELSGDFTIGGIVSARAHQGPMPAFPALELGQVPAAKEPVRVLGFGSQRNVTLPYEWSATGTVDGVGRAADGTALVRIRFDREGEPGHSGSPVLNAQDQVVGIFTWFGRSDHTIGIAIGRESLDPACL